MEVGGSSKECGKPLREEGYRGDEVEAEGWRTILEGGKECMVQRRKRQTSPSAKRNPKKNSLPLSGREREERKSPKA